MLDRYNYTVEFEDQNFYIRLNCHTSTLSNVHENCQKQFELIIVAIFFLNEFSETDNK